MCDDIFLVEQIFIYLWGINILLLFQFLDPTLKVKTMNKG